MLSLTTVTSLTLPSAMPSTWSNLRNQPTLSRLDTFLYTPKWETITQDLFLESPCIIFQLFWNLQNFKWGTVSFKFINAFLNEVGFKKNVEIWWNNTNQLRFLGYSFMRRLKQLSSTIKQYSIQKKVLLVQTNPCG